MKFGLRLPTYIFEKDTATLDTLVAYAQRADALGFDSLWVVDHYLVAQPSYRVAFLDVMQVLAAVAHSSGRLRLGTSVMQLPLRQPVMVAKEIATLDWLSNGRFEFGVGGGWQEKEFQGVGVPLNERGRRIDEYLEVMIKLWTEDETSFHGKWVNFDGIRLLPKPVQKPHPPISFGGGSTVPQIFADDRNYTKSAAKPDRVFRRIGRYASAWQATSVSDPALMQRDWEEICRYAREYGRDPSKIERMQTTYLVLDEDPAVARAEYGRIVGKDFDDYVSKSSYMFGSAAKIVEELHKRAEMGIDRMILTPVTPNVAELDRWKKEIMEPVERLTRGAKR